MFLVTVSFPAKYIISEIDQLKYLSLLQPPRLHQNSFDQQSISLTNSVENSDFSVAVGQSLDSISETRLWLYD